MTRDSKVWFITGSSSGFGRAIAEAALENGDRVAATARQPEKLRDLVDKYPEQIIALKLDVADFADIQPTVEAAIANFGQIDILVNNAGAGLVGALEEVSDEQIQKSFDTNLFGAMHLIRAVLPGMRAHQSGHIINMSAIAGFCNELGFSVYGAAKFALEGMSEALKGEVGRFGIKVTIVEPGPFRTDFIERSLEKAANRIEDYDKTSGKFAQLLTSINGKQPGDPNKAARVILDITNVKNPPLRLVLGKYACQKFRKKLELMESELNTWESTTINTDF